MRQWEGGGHEAHRRFDHTLTLTTDDGASRRVFFASSSQKEPPEIDRAMIFIGDDVISSGD